jgi:hypothetical protein
LKYSSKVVGHFLETNYHFFCPSTTQLKKKRVQKYLKEFLQTGGPDIVTNPSFHHYYVNGRETSIDQFMSPAILDDPLNIFELSSF